MSLKVNLNMELLQALLGMYESSSTVVVFSVPYRSPIDVSAVTSTRPGLLVLPRRLEPPLLSISLQPKPYLLLGGSAFRDAA